MSLQWISPVRILDLTLLGISFNIDEEFTNEEIDLSFTVNFTAGEFDEQEESLSCRYTLENILKWNIKGTDKEAFNASCKVGIYISVPKDVVSDFSEEEKQQYLSANAVSLAYGKIRSEIESITAETPVGKQVLPAIAPYEFLASLRKMSE